MSFFTVQVLQEKLNRLTLSQDSIETLSLWIIHHKAHASTSIEIWMEDMQTANADRRLMLFYLANDVLQNSRRRGANMFQDLFRDPLRRAVTLVRGQKIQTSVERMFRIWKERRVYDNSFLKELEQLIEPARQAQTSSQLTGPSFKLCLMEDALTELRKFEAELKVKSAHLKNLRVDISNPTASLSQLKDKSEGGRVSAEFDETSQKLQDFSECLGIEVNERINILDMMKDCEDYQTQCLLEVQKTSSDYKQMEKKAKKLKGKLDARIKELERAQSTATSDPTAKEDITDVGDMEIESDNETQDSLPPPVPPSLLLPTAAQPPSAAPLQPPAIGSMAVRPPTATTARFQQPQQQQLTQQSQQLTRQSQQLQPRSGPLVPPPTSAAPPSSSYPLQPPRGLPPQQPPAANAAMVSSTAAASGSGINTGGFSNLNNMPPSSSLPPRARPPPPPVHASYAPPPQSRPPPPTQVPRQPPPPRSNIPPSSNIPPGSTIPPRYQRPSFPPPSGVRPSLNTSPSGQRPPLPANFSGPPPPRPRYPPPPGNSMNIRQPLPPQRGGGPYNNNNSPNGPRPSFPPPPSSLATQANHSPSSAPPPPQLTTPLRNNSPSPAGAPNIATNAPVMTQQPIPGISTPDKNEDTTAGKDSIDLQIRNQSGLDQRLKNMVAQRMFGGVLNEYGDSSSDGDEKPYSPASDQPEISISNTGTPKPEDDNDDDGESIPTPDSGMESPDEEGASPRMNMNNPILQALYNSSPDINEKGDVQHEAPSSMTVPPNLSASVADIDTQYLKGILDTVKVKSTSSPGVQEMAAAPEQSTSQSDFEPPEAMAVTPNKAPGLAAIKDIKITPTVTNLLGELFPQLSKTLQQNKKRKQEGAEDEIAVKVPRVDETHDFASRTMVNEQRLYSDSQPQAPVPSMVGPGARPPQPNTIPPSRPGIGMGPPPRSGMRPPNPGMRPPRPGMGPSRPTVGAPRPGMRPPIPGPMLRGMPPPPTRGQFPPTNSPRGAPFPPRFRGPPPPSFRGPPPQRTRGPAPAMTSSPGVRYPGPPPPRPPSQGQQLVGTKLRAPYPSQPRAAMPPNHTGPIPPGAYPPAPTQAPINHASVTVQQSVSTGDGRMAESAPPPHPPFQGSGSFRPPRYV